MRVRFFAHLKDLTGCAETRLQIGAPASADDVWRELVALHPGLAPARGAVRECLEILEAAIREGVAHLREDDSHAKRPML